MKRKTLKRWLVLGLLCCGVLPLAARQQDGNPFTAAEYRTDAEYFRVAASALSGNMQIARQMALQEARTALAWEIQGKMKDASAGYVRKRQIRDTAAFSAAFGKCSVQAVEMTLSGMRMTASKVFRTGQGFRCWVVVEVPKAGYLEHLDKVSREVLPELDVKDLE